MADAITEQPALAGPRPGTAMRQVSSSNPIDVVMQSASMRHIARLAGLAIAVAIGTVVVLWTSEPNYAPLYTQVSGRDAAEIADVLVANDIQYKIDGTSGTIMVAQSKAAQARLKLAAQGLPQGSTQGLEMLQNDQGLGTSQFMEKARYNHALEAELSRSIESIRSVEIARVHLALPKQSIFIRNRTKPSASVMTKLFSGRRLNQGQVDAIVHMVSSSIPMLEASQVTVVDQFGRLLTANNDNDMAQTNKQFEYSRKLENSFSERIVQLLQPIVGTGKVNAQVSAVLDFASIESTREAYDPERSVVRSEQVSEQATRDLTQALGIPGALSNQPPGGGTTNSENGAEQTESATPSNQNRSSTRNYEVDRMISHTRNPSGSIQRLSVAVVIDSKKTVKDDGSFDVVPYTDEEISRFERLVKETIGYNENRGDTVSVINTAFISEVVELPEVPLWKSLLNESWLIDLVKQVLGAIGLLIVYMVFGRPFIRSLNPNRIEANQDTRRIDPETGEVISGSGEFQGGGQQLAGAAGSGLDLAVPGDDTADQIRLRDATHEQKLEMARSLVMDDPARVANVMKHWVDEG